MFILRNKSENMAQHWRSLFQFWQQFFIMLTHMWQEFSFFKFEPYLSARRPPSEPNPPGIDGAKPWCKRRPGSGWHIDICSHCNWWKLGAKRSTTWNASYISYHVYICILISLNQIKPPNFNFEVVFLGVVHYVLALLHSIIFWKSWDSDSFWRMSTLRSHGISTIRWCISYWKRGTSIAMLYQMVILTQCNSSRNVAGPHEMRGAHSFLP